MNTSFRQNIDELWGKHWGLVSLQDNWLSDKIVQFHIIKPWESLTRKQIQELLRWSDKYHTWKFIIRTSHPWDWNGLVDIMPTFKDITIEKLNDRIREISEALSNTRLKKYAEWEWIDFKSSDCTISISPEVYWTLETVTEHPNAYKSRVFMFDVNGWGESIDTYDYCLEDLSKQARKIIEKVCTDIVWWVEETSLQFEWTSILRTDMGYVFQLRNFASKNPHPLYENTLRTREYPQSRMFWTTHNKVTDKDRKNLKWHWFTDEDLERLWPYMDASIKKSLTYIWNAPHNWQGELAMWSWAKPYYKLPDSAKIVYQDEQYWIDNEINYHQPENMDIYLWWSSSPALSHHHTRYIQQVLRNPSGAALITTRWKIAEILTIAKQFNISWVRLKIVPGIEPYASNV